MEFVRGISGPVPTNSMLLPTYCYYNNTYSQQLILNSEMAGEAVITGIDFYYMSNGTVTRNIDLYIANTAYSSLNSGFVPFDNSFQLVYSGSKTFHTGWTHIDFEPTFTYDGINNVVIVMNDHTGSYSSGNNFRVHTASGLARLAYTDAHAYDPATASGSTSYVRSIRNDMRLYYDDSAE